ncbi:MAG TPA: DUF4255 domain-containing protein [Longimicrobiaceae bacterium]|jgi:hypothetical protein|nr:DUF4255 domain-containing protein [Longimicrobiaceae bacterium]
MSDYTVIKLVNEHLRQVLFDGMLGETAQFFSGLEAIHLGSPKETVEATTMSGKPVLSVFLYQVTEDPYMKNRPPVQVGTEQRMPPMALRFHYLITPVLSSPDGNALVLGKVLETMYDHPTLTITDPLSSQAEDIRVVFETLSLGDLAEVWEALREPYRVSVAYQLRVPRLQSGRTQMAVPVGEAAGDYAGATP